MRPELGDSRKTGNIRRLPSPRWLLFGEAGAEISRGAGAARRRVPVRVSRKSYT